jgi:ribosomal-protein-alanine N-acetyltransferase
MDFGPPGELETTTLEIGGDYYVCRPISIADTEELHVLDKLCFSDQHAFTEGYFFLLFLHDRAFGWALLDGDMIIAFIMVTKKRNVANIATIDIHPRYRRRGMASALIELAERELIEQDVKVCSLQVDIRNIAAIRLYHSLGYSKARRISGYYAGDGDAYLMRKQLTARETVDDG